VPAKSKFFQNDSDDRNSNARHRTLQAATQACRNNEAQVISFIRRGFAVLYRNFVIFCEEFPGARLSQPQQP
jgi:hypothetical protein